MLQWPSISEFHKNKIQGFIIISLREVITSVAEQSSLSDSEPDDEHSQVGSSRVCAFC